ncbi:MAG: hypothetical protein APR62_00685 [Smithella sp. SDB]|nr:MAG: hypothetical protein APR62_00685 [Smithella sp. SDB]
MIKKSVVLSIIIMIIFVQGIALSDDGKTLKRTIDPVIIKGKDCGFILGHPINNYNLYSYKDDKLNTIPFQIDKVINGNYVLTSGKDISKYSNNNFDKDDELVFMAKDAGNKIKDYKFKDALSCAEIEVIDPETSDKGWVYLVLYRTVTQKSSVNYVNYDAGNLTVTAANYIAAFDIKHPVAASHYSFWKGLGGNGTNLIDRVKARISMTSMGITFNPTEDDIKVKEYGYVDGPVRVIIHTINKTPLMLGISISSPEQDTIYYYTYAEFPFAVKFPIKPFAFHATIIDDFRNCMGWKFYSSTNPAGHVINGKMDASDKSLDLSPWKWSVLTNEKFGFWSRCISPPACSVKVNLYYNDNSNAVDKHEKVKGELPGIGSDFEEGWSDLKTRSIKFNLVHFFTKSYIQGMEKEICDVHDKPLKTSIKPFNADR